MYIVPSYVSYRKEKDAIYITSELYQNTIRLTDHDLQREFISLAQCGGCTELNTPLTRFLHDQELLLNEQELDQTLDKVKTLLDDIFMVTIMPTEGCNFRCPYCYEDHRAVSMTRETLDRIEEYISVQAPRYKQVVLAWFGGEPTLCKDTVLEVCEIVQDLQKQYGFKYSANMTTNGYLLDENLFRQLYQVGITSYQITIDGWSHDKTRPHVSGNGTLQTIIDNLIALSKLPREKYSFHITILHNILAGDDDYSWYDHLYHLFGQDKRFTVLVRAVGDWGGETVHNLLTLKNEERETKVNEHITYLDHLGMSCSNHRKGAFAQVCYASYPHSMVFRSDGRIVKCTVALNHSRNQLGWVDSEKGIVIDPEINRQWSFSKLKPECRSCTEVLRCMNMQCKKAEIVDSITECPIKAKQQSEATSN